MKKLFKVIGIIFLAMMGLSCVTSIINAISTGKTDNIAGSVIVLILTSIGLYFLVKKNKKKEALKLAQDQEAERQAQEFQKELEALEFDIDKFESVEPEYILGKGERCIYSGYHEIFENKTVTKRLGYSGIQGRVKIAKGLYYRAGTVNLARDQQQVKISKGDGILNITNKGILFRSSDSITNVRLSSIVDIDVYANAVVIFRKVGNSIIIEADNSLEVYRAINSGVIALNK